MENASKALLIAAAVLIVIILVAFSMKVLHSSGDTSEDASKVGKEIESTTKKTSISAIESINNSESKKELTSEEFNSQVVNNIFGESRGEDNEYIKDSVEQAIENNNDSDNIVELNISIDESVVTNIVKNIEEFNQNNTVQSIKYKVGAPTLGETFEPGDYKLVHIRYNIDGYIEYIRMELL